MKNKKQSMKHMSYVFFVKKLLLARIVCVLFSVLVFLTVNTIEPAISSKTPLQTTYLERLHLDGTIEHYIITHYPLSGCFTTVGPVFKITPDGIRVLDALPPLLPDIDHYPSKNDYDVDRSDDTSFDSRENSVNDPEQSHQSKNSRNYPVRPPSCRFSVSPYMTEKLSLSNRAQEQARQRMRHASPIITPNRYQNMLLEGKIKEFKKMLCGLENTYENTSLMRFITRSKLSNQIKDIKRVLQKSHARDLDTIATGTKQQARTIIMTDIAVQDPSLAPFAIQYKEAQLKIYRERVTDWGQEFFNTVQRADIARAKQHIQEWAQWNFADPISNNIARAFLTYADDAYQKKCQQCKDSFLTRVATEGIDPVLDVLDTVSEDTNSTVGRYPQHNKQYAALNVTQRLIQMLCLGDDRLALAHSVQSLTDTLFTNARNDNKYVASPIIDHAYYLINDIKTSTDDTRLMFTIAMTDNLLCDIQNQIAGTVYDNTPSFRERSRSLLSYVATVFAGRFNPITRVQETIDFFTGTARFVSTITAGKYYLSHVEYQRRIGEYWDTFNALNPDNLAKLSAEQWVEIGASIAGNVVLGMGIAKTARYLKEIQAVAKAQKQAADIAKKLKSAVTTALKENPYVVTAEGMVLRVSAEAGDAIGGAKEILNNANAVLKSFHEGLMRDLAAEIDIFKAAYNGTHKGFGELANKSIALDYKHILGFDLVFKKDIARIGGFHHDMMHVIEKSGILQLKEKVSNAHGFYKAKLWHNGNFIKNASFFLLIGHENK